MDSMDSVDRYIAIHTPDAIQPHGVVLVLDPSELTIVQVSNNTQQHFGITPDRLLHQPLAQLVGAAAQGAIAQSLQENLGHWNVLPVQIADQNFEAIAHPAGSVMLLELLPAQPSAAASKLMQAIAQLQQAPAPQLLQTAANWVRSLTLFDRVMVYQFDHQGAGSVVAEVKSAELTAYLGLRYPATDIPAASRALYLQGQVRSIPNLRADPVALVPAGQSVDLSQALLRSVDPCCVAFHQNLGVEALLVVALIKQQQLWGLIACHHYSPKYLSSEVVNACNLLGRFVSLELTHKVDQQALDQLTQLRALQSDVLQAIAQADNLRDALINPAPRLLDLVHAQGAAVCLGDEITLVGQTPSAEQVAELLAWTSDRVFHTDCLPKLYPPALAFKDQASGLLLLQISQVQRYSILWFRPEVLQTITWAGNPNDESLPRSSFERWQETVQCTALPWQSYELQAAIDLRTAIVGIVLKKADELAQLNLALEQRNRELDSFAYAASHDLKEPLRGIYNYATIVLEDYADRLDAEGLDCLHTMMHLTQRMKTLVDVLLRCSQIGKVECQRQPTDLNEIVQNAIAMLEASRGALTIRIPQPLPTLDCDPVLVSEVFSNLLSNGFKYNRSTLPWVEIGSTLIEEQPVLYVRDNGIGVRSHHIPLIFKLFKRLHDQDEYGGGTGAGLTIAQKIIERHGGRLWIESIYGEGSTFYFTLN
jgi:light-regulated signal transduction histidine kinase (bacteriophytochrome)